LPQSSSLRGGLKKNKDVFTSYGFEPLPTPAFERLDVLMGKYGDEGDKLIFKILCRGEHEASGEADLALRYDMTVPLARVAAGRAGGCRAGAFDRMSATLASCPA
jgi:histidyl-tRNA synthetase